MNTIAKDLSVKRILQMNDDLRYSINHRVGKLETTLERLQYVQQRFEKLIVEAKTLTQQYKINEEVQAQFYSTAVKEILKLAEQDKQFAWGAEFARSFVREK